VPIAAKIGCKAFVKSIGARTAMASPEILASSFETGGIYAVFFISLYPN
jgi:hypothetical protein